MRIDNFILILQLVGCLILVVSWYVYMTLSIAYSKRRKVLWVEVQDFIQPEYSVSRIQAKKNIYMVDEITKRLKSFNSLFDKYWYVKREFQYIDGIQRSMLYLFSNDLDSSEVQDSHQLNGISNID